MIPSDEGRKMMRYDKMELGEEFPPMEFSISEDRVRDYQRVFEDKHEWLKEGDPRVPPFVSSMDVIAPIFMKYAIAPGTIHAKQEIEMIRPVQPGKKLTAKSRVADKYIKRERKYVVFETITEDEDGNQINRNRFHFVLPE
jgi:3-hydroxybutyryl-CoA dehydratase